MSFCTLADIKDRIGEDGSDYDDVLNQINASVTDQFESYCGRKLIVTASDVTEYHTGLCHLLHLRRYPIVSITSVKESWTNDFVNDVEDLTENTDFRQASGGANGVLHKMYGTWACAFEAVQVIYRGGFCAAGVTPTGNEVALPADLREAGIQQNLFLFKRKSADIGLSGQTFEDGGFQKHETGGIIKSVRETLDQYKRVSML
ncbi:MAG: phage head-tail connector protein [Phycisphaerae bacterium]|nr:phage head-tail connector protein [Phycisphaerae bacterium]